MTKDEHCINVNLDDLDGRSQVWIHGNKSNEHLRGRQGFSIHVHIGFEEIDIVTWIDGDKFKKITKKTYKY